jgi:hypothetical protein
LLVVETFGIASSSPNQTACTISQTIYLPCCRWRLSVDAAAGKQGIRGKVLPLPEFASVATAAAAGDAEMASAEDGAGPFLVAWDVQADHGTGPVLMLARAAHCLQQLHVMNAARQPVAGSEYWQVGCSSTLEGGVHCWLALAQPCWVLGPNNVPYCGADGWTKII